MRWAKESWGKIKKEETKTCTKAVCQQKHAQERKLQKKHVSRKMKKREVLEIKEGEVSKSTKECQ